MIPWTCPNCGKSHQYFCEGWKGMNCKYGNDHLSEMCLPCDSDDLRNHTPEREAKLREELNAVETQRGKNAVQSAAYFSRLQELEADNATLRGVVERLRVALGRMYRDDYEIGEDPQTIRDKALAESAEDAYRRDVLGEK